MKQSRAMSLVEAVANVAVSYGVALATQIVVFPVFGVQASLGQNLGIGAVFTLVSLIRGYALSRRSGFTTPNEKPPPPRAAARSGRNRIRRAAGGRPGCPRPCPR